MVTFLISVLGVLLTILLVVGIHELGHFVVARLVGIKVLRFSIGFGKALYRRHDKKGTEYVIAMIPLGGYVKMLDEEEGTVPPHERHLAFNRQSFFKKLAVIAAGPLFNIIFAFILYWLLFMIGFISIIPIIGEVSSHSIAANAKLKPHQEIVSIDQTPTKSWMGVILRIVTRSGDKDSLIIQTKDLKTNQLSNYNLSLTKWHMNELRPDPLESLGITPYEPEIPPVIGNVLKNSSAEKNGLKKGDRVTAINGKPIKNWLALASEIETLPDKNVLLSFTRDHKKQTVNFKVNYKRDIWFKKHGYLGIAPDFTWPANLLRHNQYGPLNALTHAWRNTVDFTNLNLIILGKLFTGKVSLHSLGGPISIISTAGSALNQGLVSFLGFLAFLSISIGIINIVPIPGLDGGHILMLLLAAIKGKPLSVKFQILLFRLGFIAIILLITQAIVNDLLRL